MLKLIIGVGGIALYIAAMVVGGIALGVLVSDAAQFLGLAADGSKLIGVLTIVTFWLGAGAYSVTWFLEKDKK